MCTLHDRRTGAELRVKIYMVAPHGYWDELLGDETQGVEVGLGGHGDDEVDEFDGAPLKCTRQETVRLE